jgi:hypothetical protein
LGIHTISLSFLLSPRREPILYRAPLKREKRREKERKGRKRGEGTEKVNVKSPRVNIK